MKQNSLCLTNCWA